MEIPSLTEMTRHGLVWSVSTAAQLKVPRLLEPMTVGLTLSLIRLYQLILSPWLGQQCLFRPSCSERAITTLKNLGWARGVKEVDKQLHRCCGNFIVRVTQEGLVQMETTDGSIFFEAELSSVLLEQRQAMWSKALDGDRIGTA